MKTRVVTMSSLLTVVLGALLAFAGVYADLWQPLIVASDGARAVSGLEVSVAAGAVDGVNTLTRTYLEGSLLVAPIALGALAVLLPWRGGVALRVVGVLAAGAAVALVVTGVAGLVTASSVALSLSFIGFGLVLAAVDVLVLQGRRDVVARPLAAASALVLAVHVYAGLDVYRAASSATGAGLWISAVGIAAIGLGRVLADQRTLTPGSRPT